MQSHTYDSFGAAPDTGILPGPGPHPRTQIPQFGYRGELASGPFLAQAYWKNVDSAQASGESGILIGARATAGGVALRVTAGYKHLTGVNGATDEGAFEFTGEASRRFGRLTPRLSLAWSPDDLGGTRHSLYAEAGASYRMVGHTSLFASVGRRERSGGDDYTAFSAGLSQQVGDHVTAELRWNDSARSARGDAYEGRAVAMLRIRF